MIYVSSACVRSDRIGSAVRCLAEAGFREIELTGGTRYYDGFLEELISLREQYSLRYILHNYFPPPCVDFVLNLASSDDEVFEQSVSLGAAAIAAAQALGSDRYGVHAGFLVDFTPGEAGGAIRRRDLHDRGRALGRFAQGLRMLTARSDGAVEVFVENNVVSADNYERYGRRNPFLLTDSGSHAELARYVDFSLLLDLGHLKVTCQTLGLEFEHEVESLIPQSAYLHVSDNDGTADSNWGLIPNGPVARALAKAPMADRVVTVEVYGDLEAVGRTVQILKSLGGTT